MREATVALRGLTLAIDDAELEAAGLDAAIRRLVQDTAMRLDARPEVDVAESASTSDNGDVIAAVRAVLDHLERDGRATVLRLLVRPAGGDVSIEAHVDVPPRAERPSARVGDLAAAVGEFGATLEVHDGAEEIVVRVAVPAALEGRRTAAAALRGEREWAAALVAALPDPFIVSTEDLRLVEVSDRFVALTGWSRAELLGAPPGELPYWPVEDREAVRAVALGLNDEGAHDVEMTIACRDARRLDVIASAQLVQDPRAERRLQLVTFKDITARRAAERRLRDESALNRAVAGVMREPLFHTREGVVTTVNEAFCQLLGYPAERLVGATRPYFFLPPEGVDEATVYARQLAEVGYAEADLVVVRADGSRILVRARGTVVRGEDGSDLGRVQTAEYLSTVDA
jgi:PAS domain S-box-containing protein